MPVSFSPPSSWKNGVPPMIVVVGQSGAGKSDFINLAIGKARQAVGHTLASETSQVTLIDFTLRGNHCALIDCPGFDDSHGREDASILEELGGYLTAIDPTGGHITGILFMHKISYNRFTSLQSRISRTIANMCGQPAMKNAVICTTHWDTVPQELGEQRLAELCDQPGWSEMVQNGTKIVRHSNKSEYTAWAGSSVTPQSNAQGIVCDMITQGPVSLQIVKELRSGTKVADTAAGRVVDDEKIRQQKEQAEREIADARREKERVQQQMAQALWEAEQQAEKARREAEAVRAANERAAAAREKARQEAAEAQVRREREIEHANAIRIMTLQREREEAEARYHEAERRRVELENSRDNC
ncbi:hypothetical protein BKA62DRAFT_112992 [Auriculariales sp. MPI-PUGE-AT-0066]|nr:hypothetical protein BKA62DRAFT_112992 [Auriculariales sp. MPI-PUGE-AT-0066]